MAAVINKDKSASTTNLANTGVTTQAPIPNRPVSNTPKPTKPPTPVATVTTTTAPPPNTARTNKAKKLKAMAAPNAVSSNAKELAEANDRQLGLLRERLEKTQEKSLDAHGTNAIKSNNEWRIKSQFWDKDGGLGPLVTTGNSKPVEKYEAKPENNFLWKRFGHYAYARRNKMMADVIDIVRPKRVFEFAGNGGFLTREVVTRKNNSVERWVHSEFCTPVLKYASFLFDNEEAFYDLHYDIDKTFQRGLKEGLEYNVPMKAQLPSESPNSTTVEVVRVDMSDIDILKQSIDFSYFDMISTISFEHFRDDLKMIQELFRPGTWFLFSVAGFYNPEHFRFFKTPQKIHDHYGGVMDIYGTFKIALRNPKKAKWVVLGRVKESVETS